MPHFRTTKEPVAPTSTARCRRCGWLFATSDLRFKFCSDQCRDAVRLAGIRRRGRAHRERYPHREFARQTLKNAVNLGKVRRSTRCERCGEVTDTHGHHEDYSRPLYVEWLCVTCHSGLDGGRHFGAGEFKPDQVVTEQRVGSHVGNVAEAVAARHA